MQFRRKQADMGEKKPAAIFNACFVSDTPAWKRFCVSVCWREKRENGPKNNFCAFVNILLVFEVEHLHR